MMISLELNLVYQKSHMCFSTFRTSLVTRFGIGFGFSFGFRVYGKGSLHHFCSHSIKVAYCWMYRIIIVILFNRAS